MPAGSKPDQAPLMLQALLAQRFKLAFHRETQVLPVYEIAVAKNGFKLHPETPNTSENPYIVGLGQVRWKVAGTASLKTLTERLTWVVKRPVIDATGIAGVYALISSSFPTPRRAMTPGIRACSRLR